MDNDEQLKHEAESDLRSELKELEYYFAMEAGWEGSYSDKWKPEGFCAVKNEMRMFEIMETLGIQAKFK